MKPERRRRLYERDNYTCQICLKVTSQEWAPGDPWSPTLDHIEPQSFALVPDHSDENLRLVHYLCNSYRGAAQMTDAEVRAAVNALSNATEVKEWPGQEWTTWPETQTPRVLTSH